MIAREGEDFVRSKEEIWCERKTGFGTSEKDFRTSGRKKMAREGKRICCGRRNIFGASEERDLRAK